MGERLLVVVGAFALGVVAVAAYAVIRKRQGAPVDRLDIDALGLEVMTVPCAFVVFTTPTCRPCRAVLRVIRDAVGANGTAAEVRTVDALQRPDLASAYAVRTVPTTFFITASGHVLKRWIDVPKRADVEEVLGLV